MKKNIFFTKFTLLTLCALMSFACSQKNITQEEISNHAFNSPEEIRAFLIEGNKLFMISEQNSSHTGTARRLSLVDEQEPYALIVTCADSRVPPEHIFSAGLGDLFIIRNAGNVIGDFELGSIEYALEHLAIEYILVLGHEHCGAVEATLANTDINEVSDKLATIVCEIDEAIGIHENARQAEILNTKNSIEKIIQNPVVAKFLKAKKLLVEGAIYHIDNGEVVFFNN